MNILTAIYTDPIIALELIAIVLCAMHIIKSSFQAEGPVQVKELKVKQVNTSHFFRPCFVKI